MQTKHNTPDLSRRRLAAGGLVVLSSLLAKPVLGATPYMCTISGQLSGNTSSHGNEPPCTTLGLSPGYWKNHPASWPSGYIAGDIKKAADSFGSSPTTLFRATSCNGQTLADAYRSQNGRLAHPAGTDFYYGTPMSLLQVLNLNGGANDPPYPALGRATVASLFNALHFGAAYPLLPQEIIVMFNSVYQGGVYEVKPGVFWNAETVKNYFESLYG
ncbi:MAG: hypothetical protein Q8O33_09155 [Pseudomonadota bacterium]|nr:hypothetical protein [Pseudomonadota bacterium]